MNINDLTLGQIKEIQAMCSSTKLQSSRPLNGSHQNENGEAKYLSFPCKSCNKKVVMEKSRFYGRLRSTGVEPGYCSRRCGATSRAKPYKMMALNCPQCHKDFHVRETYYEYRKQKTGKPPKWCSHRCKAIALNPLGNYLKATKDEVLQDNS